MVTLELRWFAAGAQSSDELRDFAGDGTLEQRRDHYLLGTGEHRGVKRRGGAVVEDKRRAGVELLELDCDGRRASARVERWRKRWPQAREFEDSGSWLVVAKQRAVRQLLGVRAELTNLQLELPGGAPPSKELGEQAHSLAVEGLAGELTADELVAVARRLLDQWPQLRETVLGGLCTGYPGWLAGVQVG